MVSKYEKALNEAKTTVDRQEKEIESESAQCCASHDGP